MQKQIPTFINIEIDGTVENLQNHFYMRIKLFFPPIVTLISQLGSMILLWSNHGNYLKVMEQLLVDYTTIIFWMLLKYQMMKV